MILSPGEIKKIAVFRALQLGDMLCAVPAFRSLRKAYPEAEISLLGLLWAKTFVERFDNYFDRFIHFPGYEGLPEQVYDAAQTEEIIEKIQEEKFDLILQMQGNGTIVNPLILSLGSKYTAGFHNKDSRVNSPLFMEYPAYGAEIERHLLLMKHLGIPLHGTDLEYPLTKQDEAEFESLLLPVEKNNYVCVHPGSRGSWRQWPPNFFAALADHCIEKGFAVIITGTKDEIDITRQVRKNMSHTCIDLTGKTSLGAIGVLIKNAFALISNCTGVSHIASATKTKSVVISMDGEPQRWTPLNKRLHRVIDWTRDQHFEQVLLELEDILQIYPSLQQEQSA